MLHIRVLVTWSCYVDCWLVYYVKYLFLQADFKDMAVSVLGTRKLYFVGCLCLQLCQLTLGYLDKAAWK